MVVIKNESNVEEPRCNGDTGKGSSFLKKQLLPNAVKVASKSLQNLPHLANPSINNWAVLITRLNCTSNRS